MLYYRHIFKTLNKFQLSYVIVGGIAVNLHGYDRLTGDIDIAISLTDVEIGKFIKAAKELSLVPRVPVRLEDFLDPVKREEWIQEKNMKVFSVYNPKNAIEHIDVMIT
ncbi:MAG: hypothetical protein HY540_04455, partial [Deltaproteobacteria bacterium]|nr:hypothetical protein [Deltaproteobacteria bacterium]